jgi:hypothetical protein
MATKRQEHRGSYDTTDSDGQLYTIHKWVEIIEGSSSEDPNAEKDGMVNFRTATGLNVNCLGNGKFKIVQTGVTLTSSDPDAS